MKRKLLYLVVLAIFSAGIAYSQYIEDTITVNRTLEPPLIDGYNDDEAWETEEFYTITEYGLDEFDEPQSPDPGDFIAQYKMLWDDEYIYFLGVITDDFVSDKSALADAGAPTWENDSWEFYIAPTLSKLPSMEEMTQIRWSYATSALEDGAADAESYSSFGDWPGYSFGDFEEAAREMTAEGWVLEARLELALIAAKVDGGVLTDGSEMGWQITVSDNDGEEFRDWIGSWIPDTQWDEADTLGILKLGADLSGTVGIEKSQVGAQFSLYPNPVGEKLHISGVAEIEAIEIMNSVGALLIRRSNIDNGIDVSDLQTGLYFVKVYSGDGLLETQKFLKK
jgi:hypothetical protein